MRVLLDESLPAELADELNLPSLKTVAQLGLKGFKNGDLLRRAEVLGIEVLITADQNLAFQQHLRPLVPAIHQALGLISPGHVLRLGV